MAGDNNPSLIASYKERHLPASAGVAKPCPIIDRASNQAGGNVAVFAAKLDGGPIGDILRISVHLENGIADARQNRRIQSGGCPNSHVCAYHGDILERICFRWPAREH